MTVHVPQQQGALVGFIDGGAFFALAWPVVCPGCGHNSMLIIHRDAQARCIPCDADLQKQREARA